MTTTKKGVYGLRELALRLARAIGPETWMDDIACKGRDTNSFFVENPSDGRMNGEVKAAKLLCARCDVRPQCLAFGMKAKSSRESGIYGGTTARDRLDFAFDQEALLEFHARQVMGWSPPTHRIAANVWESLRKEEVA